MDIPRSSDRLRRIIGRELLPSPKYRYERTVDRPLYIYKPKFLAQLQRSQLQGLLQRFTLYRHRHDICIGLDIPCSSDHLRRMGGRGLPPKPKYGYGRTVARTLYISISSIAQLQSAQLQGGFSKYLNYIAIGRIYVAGRIYLVARTD